MEVGNIGVKLTLDGNDFALSARQASRVVRELRQQLGELDDQTGKVDRGHNRMFRTLRDGVIVFALLRDAVGGLHDLFLALPSSFIKASGEMERMTQLMRGLSKETTEFGKNQEALRDRSFLLNMAKSAPFDIKALTDSFVKLKTAGLDPTTGSAKTLIDSVAKFGGNSETLKRASVAIQQMSGKGVISMEELRQQLGEAVPTAMEAMSRGMHMTMSELVKAVSTGTVKAEGALKRMFVVMEMQNRGAALAMMDTIPGKVAQLTTSWEIFKASVGDGAFSNSVKRVMDDINRSLNSPGAADFASRLGTNLGDLVDILAKVARGAAEVGPMLASLAAGYALLRASQAAGRGVDSLMNGNDSQKGLRQAFTDFKTNQAATFRQMIADRESLHRQAFESEKRRIVESLQASRDAASQQLAIDRKTNANRKAQMSREITDFRKKEDDRVSAALASEARMLEGQREALVRKKAMLETFQRDFNSQIMLGPNNSIRGVIENGQLQGVNKDEAARIKNQMRELKSEISAVDIAMSSLSVNSANVRKRVADDTNNTINRMAANQRAAAAAMDSSISATGARLSWLNTQLQAATASTHNMTAAMRLKATAAASARMAVQGLGFVINAMGGWVGLAVTAIAGLVAWLGTLKSKAEETRDAMEALSLAQQTGKASSENVDSLETNRNNAASKVRATESEIRDLQILKAQVGAQAGISAAARKKRQDEIDATIREKQSGLAKTKAELSIAEQQLGLVKTIRTKTVEAASIRGLMALNDEQIRKNVSPYQKQADEANTAYEKARAAGVSKEALSALNVKAMNAELTFHLQMNNQLTTYQKKLNAARSSMLPGAYEEYSKKVAADLKTTRNAIANVREALQAPGPDAFTNGNGKGGAGKPIPPSFFEMDKNMLIKQNIERVAALNLLEESMGEMLTYEDAVKQYRAAYQKMADDGVFDRKFKRKGKDGKEESYTERPGAGELNEAADEAALKYKLDMTKKVMTQIKQASDDMKSTYDSLKSSDGDDSIQGPLRKFEKLRDVVMKSKGMMDVGLFKRTLAELDEGQTAAVGVTVEKFTKMAEDKANAAADALLTAQQRQDVQLQRSKEEWLKTFNDIKKAAGATPEVIEKAEIAYNKLLNTANKSIDRTPVEQLGQSWMDMSNNMQNATANWTSSFADAMTDMAMTGKANFSDMAKAIQKDIVQMTMRMLVFKSLSAIPGFSTFGASPTPTATPTPAPAPDAAAVRGLLFARGGAFDSGNLIKAFARGGAFTNGITTGTNIAPMAMFGEAGPEAILPLAETSTGLGVRATLPSSAGGASQPTVIVNVVNASGQQVNAEQRGKPRFDGKQMILDVVLSAVSTPGSFRDGIKAAVR